MDGSAKLIATAILAATVAPGVSEVVPSWRNQPFAHLAE